MRIKSAALVRYNANTRGTSTGDCTARAISLAFNIDYTKARKALNNSAKENWKEKWNYNSINNVKKVIQDLGGGPEIKCDEKITLGDWADKYSSGVYIVHCNRTGQPHGPGGHLVCVIDGKIYDSWDSRNYYPVSYHVIESGISSTSISDNLPGAIESFFSGKDPAEWDLYVSNTFDSIVDKNRRLKKLAKDYDTDISLSIDWRQFTYSSYNFKMNYTITLSIPKYGISENYSSKIGITFKPTLPVDEVEDYFNASFASKMHPFINNVSIKAEDILEGENLTSGASPTGAYDVYKRSWDGIVRRSFNNLPHWARKLVTYFKVDPPSRYGYYNDDKVELRMQKPQFDTTYATDPYEKVSFEAESMELLKKALEHYKQTGDYEESYEIARGIW